MSEAQEDSAVAEPTKKPNLTAYEKIQILLEEYRSLRSEVAARLTYGAQIGTLGVGAIAWVLGHPDMPTKRLILLLGFIFLSALGILWIVSIRDVWRLSKRLQALEHEINSRAGEHLLVWEQLHGGGSGSQWRAFFVAENSRARSELKPLDRYT